MPVSRLDAKFVERLADAIARKGRDRVRPKVRAAERRGFGSRTLARSLTIKKGAPGVRHLYIPHYWARIVHDGRGPMSAAAVTRGGLFVWYKNPRLDPRNRGGYPVRATARRHLSRSEFKRDLAAGRIIVARQVGGMRGNPFFLNSSGGGMRGFEAQARTIGREMFSEHLRRRMGSMLYIRGKVIIPL